MAVVTPLYRAIETAHIALEEAVTSRRYVVTPLSTETATKALGMAQKGHCKEDMIASYPHLETWDLTL